MKQRRLMQADRDFIKDITARRRAAYAAVRQEWPTNEDLAQKFGCTKRVVERWASVGITVNVPHGTRRCDRRMSQEEIDELADELRESK
jgi:hypothetical protein